MVVWTIFVDNKNISTVVTHLISLIIVEHQIFGIFNLSNLELIHHFSDLTYLLGDFANKLNEHSLALY